MIHHEMLTSRKSCNHSFTSSWTKEIQCLLFSPLVSQVHDVKFMAREEVLDLGKVLIAAIYGFRTPCIRLPCVTQEDDVNGQNWALEFGGNEFQSNSVSKKLLFFFSWHILSVQECGSTWACTGLSMHGCERASACMSVRKIRKCGRRA